MDKREQNRIEILEITRGYDSQYETITLNTPSFDMWICYVIYRSKLGTLEHTSCYFEHRGDAEHWFSEKTKNLTSYYGCCCNDNTWYNVDDLLNWGC